MRGMDFLCVLLRLLARAEKERKRQTGEEAMACRLPFLRRRLATAAILGACFAWGLREREEILPWRCEMRNDTVSPNVAPHRPLMD